MAYASPKKKKEWHARHFVNRTQIIKKSKNKKWLARQLKLRTRTKNFKKKNTCSSIEIKNAQNC